MIDIRETSLRTIKLDIALYCQYNPNGRGNVFKLDCQFEKSRDYYKWYKNNKEKFNIIKNIQYTLIPIYKPVFINPREILFHFGNIRITDNLKSEPNQNYDFLKEYKLYLRKYNSDNDELLHIAIIARKKGL